MLPIINAFLAKHNFPVSLSVTDTVNSLLYDMRLGLGMYSEGKAGEDMIQTWLFPPKSAPKNEKVIVIDAGGTNFRTCLVSFDGEGKASISDFNKTKMPGVERELSKKEFFAQIADNLDYLKNKADKIGFCFSYAMKITKEGDGVPTVFSKEVRASEVIGIPVGRTLVEELESRGWNKIKRITLVNDTVSALLSGSSAFGYRQFSSYIGFILGTGLNAAYIQPEEKNLSIERQIVVCESGKCDKLSLSDFDISLDKKTNIPGQYLLEKGCSGAYLGKIVFEMISCAANEGLFSARTSEKISSLDDLTLIDVDSFLYDPFKKGLVSDLCETEDDRRIIYELSDAAVTRTARYAAAILAANAIQCNAGFDVLHPICIVANGTTFYKTHNLRSRIESYLGAYLGKKGIHYEIVSVENDITVGTAVAGLI